ncbi:polysaccharide pyruvyl transferase family protein [Haloferax sp. AS1]|uniref:polysaccharide pyruvyl transferase family protein n=1 Tax=Haloferax TaxID=2251 RepID=UPI00165EC140|nr:polysaccharide pyruvyl transferase family protein [Haloferax sp. AS1]MBC9987904.1 polysaccharide pyruvyl transferase family protein [Haloferax sp. AS1]
MTNNILFISDTSDGQNWGCFATSKILRRLINNSATIEDTIFLENLYYQEMNLKLPSVPDIQYVLREWAKVPDSEGNVLDRLYYHGAKPLMDIFDFLPMTAAQFDVKADKFANSDLANRFFGSIENVDDVVINGEGSIHGPGRKAKMLLFLAYLAKNRYDTDTHIINHTLQMNDPALQQMVELVYPTLDTLIFREPLSMDHYLSKVKEGNVVQGADAAWCFDKILPAEKLNEIYNCGGISIWYPRNEPNRVLDFTRPYITVGGGSGFGRHDTNAVAANFIDVIQSIEYETSDVGIILTAAAHSDEEFMLKVSEETGHPLVKLNNTSKIAASIIGNSEVYLGGRWHPSIFALLGGTPLVNFNGNTFKIQAIKEQFDLEHPIYRCEEMKSRVDEITASVSRRLGCNGEDNTPTEKEIKEMRSLVKMNVDAIFE